MKIYGKLTVIVFILIVFILCINLQEWSSVGERFVGDTLLEIYNKNKIQEAYDDANIIFINDKLKYGNDKYNRLLRDYSNYLSTNK
jgi:hypothetical protein